MVLIISTVGTCCKLLAATVCPVLLMQVEVDCLTKVELYAVVSFYVQHNVKARIHLSEHHWNKTRIILLCKSHLFWGHNSNCVNIMPICMYRSKSFLFHPFSGTVYALFEKRKLLSTFVVCIVCLCCCYIFCAYFWIFTQLYKWQHISKSVRFHVEKL